MKGIGITMGLLAVTASTLATGTALAARHDQEVTLRDPTELTRISGFAGSVFTVGVPDSEADEYALYGLTSEERRDHPCYVTIRTENVNDPTERLDLKKNLCGGKERSREIKVEYGHADYDKRVFVTGARVCMNDRDTRVKGISLRGRIIGENARLIELEPARSSGTSGLTRRNVAPPEPRDDRPHCNGNWKRWAECPAGRIATAARLHFEAGSTPRSWTGIALECRRVGLSRAIGAVRVQ